MPARRRWNDPPAGCSPSVSIWPAITRTRHTRPRWKPPCAAAASLRKRSLATIRHENAPASGARSARHAPAQQPLLLAGPFALLDGRALVVLLLALRKADRQLDAALRVVQVDRCDRVAGALDLADQAVDLLAMHQQSARARRIGMHVRRSGRERGDMRADQHQPAVLDDDVRLLEMRAPAANRLHFPAFQRNPGLEAFLDKIVVKGLAVLDNAHWNHTHFCGRRRCARASRRFTARA